MAIELGTAYVSIVSDTRGVQGELEDAYRRAGRIAGDEGGRVAAQSFSNRFGNTLRSGLGNDLQNAMRTSGQAAGEEGGRQAAQGFSNRFGSSLGGSLGNDLSNRMRQAGRSSGEESGRQAAQGFQDRFRQGTRDAGRDMNRDFGQQGHSAGQEGGRQAAQGMGERLADMLGGKAGIVGSTVAAAFSLAGLSAGGLFIKALQKGMENEQAIVLTQARLGADDATMQKIAFAAGQAFTSNFGESVSANMDTARRAIQSGLLDPNATAKETQEVIQGLSGISELMGEEIPATARAAGQAIKTGMAKNATEAFDLFATAERNGLNVSEDFLDTITEYGTQFRKIGLSGPEAIGLISQAVKNGARDTDKAADAIKEFSIRIVDGSDSSIKAFQDLGFNADDLTRKFAQGGSVAREATGDLLTKIAQLQDPVKKNQIALALFGTQFEDLGDALNKFDLNNAVAQLGQVDGAARSALDTMGSTAAGSIESAKRSISVATDAISNALAKAFGPELSKLATWVTTHQPEVIQFFATVASTAFKTADAFLAFSSTGLRAIADFVDGAGVALGAFLGPLGAAVNLFGKLTHNEDMQDIGSTLQDLRGKFAGAADGARALADGIDNTARPALAKMGDDVKVNIEQMQRASEVTRALGTDVNALPSGHDIIITENTPEVQQRLEALGLKITQLPDGRFLVTANTQDAQQRLDAFVAVNTGKKLPLILDVDWSRVEAGINNAQVRASAQVYSPESGYVHYAQGGIREPGISNGVPGGIVWAEAGPEAYIPLDPGKRQRSAALWLEVGNRLGMLRAMAEGGIAGKRAQGWAQAQDHKPYIYGPQDCSWYMSGIYNQLTGKDVRFTTASDFTQYGFKPGSDPGGFTIGTNGGIGVNGHMGGTLFGTNVENDGTNGVQYGGTADGAASFPKQFYLPRDLWSPPETDNPSSQSGGAGLGAGTGALGRAGASPGAGGAFGGSGAGAGAAGSGGASVNGQNIPAGVTPVWVVNFGTATEASGADQSQSQDTGQFAPTTSSSSTASTNPAADLGSKALSIGTNFVQANIDGLLGDIGIRSSGGAIQAIAQQVFNAMSQALSQAIADMQRSQQGSMIRQAGRPLF